MSTVFGSKVISMNKCIITGAAGLLGSYICEQLYMSGINLVAVDKEFNSQQEQVQ